MTALLEKPVERNFQAQLIARAWHDPTFKEKLLADPRPAMEEELDIRLPEDLQVTVLEETPDSLYLVLPANGSGQSGARRNGVNREIKPERDFQEQLINKARQHAGFKAKLLADPKPAIEEEFGIILPEHLRVKVVEQTPSRFYLMLPINRTELSEVTLNAPVGGTTGDCATNCCNSSSASASGCGWCGWCWSGGCGGCSWCNSDSSSNCCW
jgi:hypothetical protein